MDPHHQYERHGSIFTKYKSPLLPLPYPRNLQSHLEDLYSPTTSRNNRPIAVYPTSAYCQNTAVMPCTSHYLTHNEQIYYQRKRKRHRERAQKLARTNFSRNQLSVENCPQECVHPNVTITSTTSSVRIETVYSSASKVVNQTSDVASAMADIPGEHSQSRDEKGPRNQQEACTGPDMQDESTVSTHHGGTSTSSIAIRRKDCLGTKLNIGDVEKIQMALHRMIDKHSSNTFSPHFEDYTIQNDSLIVHCANVATVQWLKGVFYTNGKVFAGLRLVRVSELPKVRVAFKTKDVLTSDPMVFLKRLQLQNPNLHTQHWMIEESPTMELGLQTKELLHCWVFRIDQGSVNVIKATNMVAYTGLCKGTFEFLPDVEPPEEIVIKQEAEPSSA